MLDEVTSLHDALSPVIGYEPLWLNLMHPREPDPLPADRAIMRANAADLATCLDSGRNLCAPRESTKKAAHTV
jgi:hypothetical protein